MYAKCLIQCLTYNKNPVLLEASSVPGTVPGALHVKVFDPYNKSRTHHHQFTNEESEAQRCHRPSEGQSWDSKLGSLG